jgi:hypothetical protein
MKIFLCASRSCYGPVARVRDALERQGHLVTLPNNFDDPSREERIKARDHESYARWKEEMLRLQVRKVEANDGVLVLNLEKDGSANYLGGATFLEVFKAWELGKKVFLFNPIPDGILHDELVAMRPTVIDGDLELVR